jgi:hypothetical protein
LEFGIWNLNAPPTHHIKNRRDMVCEIWASQNSEYLCWYLWWGHVIC